MLRVAASSLLRGTAATSAVPLRAAAVAQQQIRSKYTLPDLKYPYEALEPVISRDIMALHHGKHHATYVANLNAALDKLKEAEKSGNLTEQIELQNAIKFNAGGHLNHVMFWENLTPVKEGGGKLDNDSAIAHAIERDFGGFTKFVAKFNATTAAIQGSGWGWLVYNPTLDALEIKTTSNQDMIQSPFVPLLAVDVWEHAYYLDYKNVRASYLEKIWQVVNWKDVSGRYDRALVHSK